MIAKAPVPGRVKTRLSPPCTPEQAAALARAALRDTFAAASRARHAGRRVAVLDGEPGPWVPRDFEVIPQRGARERGGLVRRARGRQAGLDPAGDRRLGDHEQSWRHAGCSVPERDPDQ